MKLSAKLKGIVRHVGTAAGGGLVGYGVSNGVDPTVITSATDSIASNAVTVLDKIEVILGLCITLAGLIASWRAPEKRVEK